MLGAKARTWSTCGRQSRCTALLSPPHQPSPWQGLPSAVSTPLFHQHTHTAVFYTLLSPTNRSTQTLTRLQTDGVFTKLQENLAEKHRLAQRWFWLVAKECVWDIAFITEGHATVSTIIVYIFSPLFSSCSPPINTSFSSSIHVFCVCVRNQNVILC